MNIRAASSPTLTQASALVATIGVGAAGWIVAIPRMRGMDMGTATALGSFPFFLSVWVPMMAAMMLPGTARAALLMAADGRRFLGVPGYVASYLGVWSVLAGVLLIQKLVAPRAAIDMPVATVIVALGLAYLTQIT